MAKVDEWFSKMVAGELQRLHTWNEQQQGQIDKLRMRQAVIWFILGAVGTVALTLLGKLLG